MPVFGPPPGLIVKKKNGLLNGLVSYFSFENNLTPSHGTYIVTNSNGVSYEDGINGFRLKLAKVKYGRVDTSIPLINARSTNLQTISIWHKLENTSREIVIGSSAAGTGQNHINIYLSTKELFFHNTYYGGDNPVETPSSYKADIPLGWHHIVLIKTGARKYDLYFDNIRIFNSVTRTSRIDSRLVLGKPYIASYAVNYDSNVDELGVWDRAITPQEVSLLWNEGYGLFYSRFTT